MAVINPGGSGGGSAIAKGTAAARPAAGAATSPLYWATDTNELTYTDGAAWRSIDQLDVGGADVTMLANNFGILHIGNAAFVKCTANQIQLQSKLRTIAGIEAAAATAGAGAAPPATVQGYFVFTDSAGVDRKIPYYAN